MNLIYYVIGASIIPLFDVMLNKNRSLIQYAIYIGWWGGLWSAWIVSELIRVFL